MKVIIANIGGHIWFRQGNTPDHQEILTKYSIIEVDTKTYKSWQKLWDSNDKIRQKSLQRILKEYL
jgi:hypothetical protein